MKLSRDDSGKLFIYYWTMDGELWQSEEAMEFALRIRVVRGLSLIVLNLTIWPWAEESSCASSGGGGGTHLMGIHLLLWRSRTRWIPFFYLLLSSACSIKYELIWQSGVFFTRPPTFGDWNLKSKNTKLIRGLASSLCSSLISFFPLLMCDCGTTDKWFNMKINKYCGTVVSLSWRSLLVIVMWYEDYL